MITALEKVKQWDEKYGTGWSESSEDLADLLNEYSSEVLEEYLKKYLKKYVDDFERLNKIQELSVGYGKGWILRMSTSGRGLRLHETSQEDAVKDIREAIDNYINVKDRS